jgi:hypothetical protein
VVGSNNLLIRLHHWVNRQDENFTTEAFVHVLQRLIDHEPEVGIRILAWLTEGVVDLQPEELTGVSLKTQVATNVGRPDVEIQTIRHRVFLEAKVESGVGSFQLEKYRGELETCGAERTALLLLTRYPVPPEVLGGKPDKCVRWYEIADWLTAELAAGTIKDPVSRHTVGQFLGFLSARGMTMEQVGWEMVQGVRALRNFLALLAEAARACGLSAKPSKVPFGLSAKPGKGPGSAGFSLQKSQVHCFLLGFNYEAPGTLHLHTDQIGVDPDKAVKLGKGSVGEWKWSPNGRAWGMELELESEEVHFFARSRASQMQCLEKFIGEFLDGVRQIEAPGPADTSVPGPDEEGETDGNAYGG